jgi:hypothetical protein
MKGPEGICGATCALLYTFYYPRRSKEERKKLKRISIWSLTQPPEIYFDQIGVAYTCTASRWLYHNMSKSQLGIDLGDLSITSRCWSLSRSPTRLCLSVVWRNDTQWGRNIRSDHLPSILALLFIIWLFDRRRKKQTIKNVQHVVCVCVYLATLSPAHPVRVIRAGLYFYIIWWRHLLPPPPLLPWYSPLFFVTSIKRRWIKNK